MHVHSWLYRVFFSPRCRRPAVELLKLGVLAWAYPATCDEIQTAAFNGGAKQVKALLNHHPDLVFRRDKTGWTALHFAAYEGHGDMAELQLAHNAETDAKDEHGRIPLHYAAVGGGR
jgi:ankyrin repeat protein